MGKFIYLGSSVSSTEKDMNMQLAKVWTAIDRLSVMWKSDLTDKIKCSFFPAAVVSKLLYECTTWMLIKCIEKKLDSNYTRMLWAILNKSWRQHPVKQQLYSHLPPITKTIQVRRTRHTGHCWRSKDELISNILLWTPSHGWAKAGWPARSYIQQLCADTGYSLEDLSGVMDDRDGWRERVREIHASSTTWWWYQLSGQAIFFWVSCLRNNGLYLFWNSFEWFYLQIRSETKYFFLSCPMYWDWRLIVVIVY